MTATAPLWPLLLPLAGFAAIYPFRHRIANWARWQRRAQPSIEQVSHDRAEVVHPQEET